jgi:hypothetical protein
LLKGNGNTSFTLEPGAVVRLYDAEGTAYDYTSVGHFTFGTDLSADAITLTWVPVPVPEPGAVLGVAAAGLGLAGRARRRRAARAAVTPSGAGRPTTGP